MSKTQGDQRGSDRADQRQGQPGRAETFPSSRVHGSGTEKQGPTGGHEFATDTDLAAEEKGEHSQLPVEGGAEVEQVRRQEQS